MSRFYLILGEVLFMGILGVVAVAMFRQHPPVADAVRADIKLSDSRAQVYLQRDAAGAYQYFLCHSGEAPVKVSYEQLTEQIYQSGKGGWLASTLGASSPTVVFWLSLGLFGQLLFTGRMIVQWVASERKGTSVVPPTFWWMSLIGSLLLLAYFLWRRDPIGLLGQAFGSFVYLRNIIWILEGKRLGPVATTTASEPLAPA